jgi:hypothetical protein
LFEEFNSQCSLALSLSVASSQHTKTTKSKSNNGVDGLKTNWSKNKAPQLLPHGKKQQPLLADDDEDVFNDGPVRVFGGLVDDDEDAGLERQELNTMNPSDFDQVRYCWNPQAP